MPNWLNRDRIKTFLARDGQHGRLLMLAAYRALENDARCAAEVAEYPDPPPKDVTRELFEARGPFHAFEPPTEVVGMLERIERWLVDAVAAGECWIAKTDADGRVPRLRNIKTLEDALQLAAADDARRGKLQEMRADLARGNSARSVRVVKHLGEGSLLVEMLTRPALEFEGRHMGSCLRNRSHYYAQRRARGYRYFSIRDAQGRPCVTLEVLGRSVLQCKGRCNDEQLTQFSRTISELAAAMDWDMSAVRPQADTEQPELFEHPAFDRLLAAGDLIVGRALLPLPCTLFVEGNLEAADLPELTALPSMLHVQGDLLLRNCRNLRRMPERLCVEGDTVIRHCRAIRQVATYFSGDGSLTLSDCANVRLNPARMEVGGALEVRRCPKVELPPGALGCGVRVPARTRRRAPDPSVN